MTSEAERQTRTITIKVVIDAVGALANDTLEGSTYLTDTNRANGSSGAGTEQLKTVVEKGDRVVWTVLALECEAYLNIEDISIDSDVCVPEKKTYEGTDVSYWVGKVKKDIQAVPYKIKIKVGSRKEAMTTVTTPFLVGRS